MTRRLLLCLLCACALPAAAQDYTLSLWHSISPIYEKTLIHPFLKGLTDGNLPRDRFQYYLVQDRLYLRAFAQALNVVASKAPREEWALTLTRHSTEAIEAERALHDDILKSWGVPAATAAHAEMAPTNAAYTNHLLAAAHRGTFAEGLAALLPCYWIYWEVGKELVKKGSKNPVYQRWIDNYAGEDYAKSVREAIAILDGAIGRAGDDERARARAHFVRSARYEFMFWDMAWRKETWPPN
jgi:thiaminase (transcriptional activator TenA)